MLVYKFKKQLEGNNNYSVDKHKELVSKEMKDTIIADKFEKGKKYQSVSEFIIEFSLLKQVIKFFVKLELL